MNQFMLFGLILALFSNYIKMQVKSTTFECGNAVDCFECSLNMPDSDITNEYCEYNPISSVCIKGINKGPFDPFYKQWSKCTDQKSEEIQTKYCGVTYKERNKDSKEIFGVNIVDGKYGRKYTLCQYTFVNDDEDANTFVNVQINKDSGLKMQILLEATYFNGTKANALVDKYNYYVLINTCREANLYYLGLEDFTTQPFQIIVYAEAPGISITLIVTIVLVVLACLVCSISIYVFSKRVQRRTTSSQQQGGMMMANGIIIPPGETEESIRRRRMKQLHILLNETIISRNYSEDLGKMNSNCTVCFENYDKISNVCVTECKHVFHYDCLKSWLEKNILNAKCPNCNFMILPDINELDPGLPPAGDNGMIPMQSVPFATNRSNANIPNTAFQHQSPSNIPTGNNMNVAYNSYQPNQQMQMQGYQQQQQQHNRQSRSQNNNFVDGGGNGTNNAQSNRAMRNNPNYN